MQDRRAAPLSRDINGRIARRVRALRAELGMTLDALAAKSEVSRSMISLVERGESSPTAAVLRQNASAFARGIGSMKLTDAPPSTQSISTSLNPSISRSAIV